MTPEQVKEQEKLQEHIYKTYYGLRNGFFAIAILFPVLLAVIGWWNHIQLQGSMSAYYFAFAPPESPLRVFPARAVFVGFLFMLGICLILYKGYSKQEDWLLNIAGAAGVVAALVPMQTPPGCNNCGSNTFAYVHEIAGVVGFVCIASVALFCTNKTLIKVPDNPRWWRQKQWFRRAYNTLGILMILAPLTAIVMTVFFGIYDMRIFFAEGAGLWVFAIFWLVRTWELHVSQAEWNALTFERPRRRGAAIQ
jgi:hypothetical protein